MNSSFPAQLKEILGYEVFRISDNSVNLLTLVTFLLIMILTVWTSRLVQRALAASLRRRELQEEGTIKVTNRLMHYIVMAIGVGIAVNTLGIDLSALFAAGALFAVGIGFAMRNIAENFVAGVILMVERAIKPGDILQVDNEMVRVIQLGTRATIVRTLNDEDMIVPNSILVTTTVKNYTRRDLTYRLRTFVGVTYSSDLALVEKTLLQVARSFPLGDKTFEPVILLLEYGDSSINFEVSVWINNPWRQRRARSMMNMGIWKAFQEAGIVIAFPQLDVHFDPEVSRSFASLNQVR